MSRSHLVVNRIRSIGRFSDRSVRCPSYCFFLWSTDVQQTHIVDGSVWWVDLKFSTEDWTWIIILLSIF